MLNRMSLDLLQESDFEQYKAEIQKPWDTEADDLADLMDIIQQNHGELKNGQIEFPVQLQEGGEGVDINMPGWVIVAIMHFEKLYGLEYGSVVFEKLMSRIWDKLVPARPISVV